MSVGWNFFVSRRIRKCDVETWLKENGIINSVILTTYLRGIKVRPPTEEEMLNIKWPILAEPENNKSKQDVKNSDISFGQKALNKAIENSNTSKKSIRKKKITTSSKALPAKKRRKKKSENE